jgi:hypothetical protein
MFGVLGQVIEIQVGSQIKAGIIVQWMESVRAVLHDGESAR